MTSQEQGFQDFADFAAKLKGDEKSEAQTFLFHLLEAYGHDANTLPAGASFEYRIRFPGDKTKFSDLVWPARVLMEMKSRGAKLSRHYQQTFDYWLNLVPHRPPYVVLCDFDEFWIYDFNTQLQEPLDRVKISELAARHSALNFLYPRKSAPIFGNNWVEVTREAANDVARAFNEMVQRGEPRDRARRFALQCVVSMFSEDIGLLPADLFTSLLEECRRADNPGETSYDLLGQLFRQMNDAKPARGGKFAGVDYFNGGLFNQVEPVALTPQETGLLLSAAKEDWSKVSPVIFGTIFESSLQQDDEKDERHALGAHFTYEADIQKIVRPTIVRPWEERIAAAKNVSELLELLRQLRAFRVLDPACGSGNFLFVAYRALRELEQNLLVKLFTQDKRQFEKVGTASGISPKQFFGLDVNDNAVEIAKVTLMLACRLASRHAHEFWDAHADVLPGGDTHALQFEKDLPLENLNKNILCADALFTPWPEADAIIGNPPFQSKNKMQQEFGPAYVQKLRAAYPAIPGRADFCVYWFRRAHDHLKSGQRAGLVGTNTIRQNYSREGGLDHIVNAGGTIVDAVSSQVWSGEAVVHVSLVNWIKGAFKGKRTLMKQLGDDRESPWEKVEVPTINSSLSFVTDVGAAKRLQANTDAKACFQGQTHGHEGFLLTREQAHHFYGEDGENYDVVFPFLAGDDLLSTRPPSPTRYVIDFHPRDFFAAARYKKPFEIVKTLVLPDREKAANQEAKRNKEVLDKNPKAKVNHHHQNFLNHWWLLSWARAEMVKQIFKLPRYIVCSRVTKRPVFEFVSDEIRPNDSLSVFAFADDYSFGILQSGIHWLWFTTKCSTLKGDFRYTSDTVFDTFAWPQFEVAAGILPAVEGGILPPGSASKSKRAWKLIAHSAGLEASALRQAGMPAATNAIEKIRAVAEAARALRNLRREIMDANGWSLRELYKSLETPGANRLRDAHAALDAAVRAAYGMKPAEDILVFLLKLNLELADKEAKGEAITPPGLPAFVPEPESFVSRDCVRSPDDPEADGSTAKSAADAAHFYGKEEGPPYRTD
jgi:type II restriction/modification system DNA methylase subunit YeeA